MTLTDTTVKTERLTYNRTIGITAMFGRGFYYPVDIVGGEGDRLYVLNRSSDGDKRGVRITVMNLDEDYFGIFGAFGEDDGQFIWPNSIAIDSRLRLFITDDYLTRITALSTDGDFIGKWGVQGSSNGEMDGPNGVGFNSDDELLVVDHRNHRVQKFTGDGVFVSSFGALGSGEGQFNMPWGISVCSDDTVLVADWGNDRVQKLTQDGQFICAIGSPGNGPGELHRPSSACEDDDGYLYIADWGNHRVQVFDSEGRFVQLLRGEATLSKWAQDFLNTNVEEAKARALANLDLPEELFERDANEESSHIERYFWGPSAIKLIGGHIYVVDTVRHRIQVYDIVTAN